MNAGADNAVVHAAPLADGAPAHGPYDVMVLQGGVVDVPEGLLDQLKDGGRIAALFMDGALGTCRIGYKDNGALSWRFAFNAAAPVMPGFEAASLAGWLHAAAGDRQGAFGRGLAASDLIPAIRQLFEEQSPCLK